MTRMTKLLAVVMALCLGLLFLLVGNFILSVPSEANEARQRLPKGVVLTDVWVSGGHKVLVSTYCDMRRSSDKSISTIHHPACPCGGPTKGN